MPIRVGLPNGGVRSFPDEATPEQIQEVLRTEFVPTPEPVLEPEPIDDPNAGEAFVRGLKSGVIGEAASLATLGRIAFPGLPTQGIEQSLEEKAQSFALSPETSPPIYQTFQEKGAYEGLKNVFDPEKVAFGVGQALPFLATTVAGAGAVSRFGTAARFLVGGGIGGALEGAQTFREAEALGSSPGKARLQFVESAVAIGLLNMLPVEAAFFRGKKGGILKEALKIAAIGGAEAGTEFLEEPTNALILGTNISDSFKQGLEVLVPSFILGGGIGGFGSVMQNDRVEDPSLPKNETPWQTELPSEGDAKNREELMRQMLLPIVNEEEIEQMEQLGLLHGFQTRKQFTQGEETEEVVVDEERGFQEILNEVFEANNIEPENRTLAAATSALKAALPTETRNFIKQMGKDRAVPAGVEQMISEFLFSRHFGDSKARGEYRKFRNYLNTSFAQGMTLDSMTNMSGIFTPETQAEMAAQDIGLKGIKGLPAVKATGLLRDPLPAEIEQRIRDNFPGAEDVKEAHVAAWTTLIGNLAESEGTTVKKTIDKYGFGPMFAKGNFPIKDKGGLVALPVELSIPELTEIATLEGSEVIHVREKADRALKDINPKYVNEEGTISSILLTKKVLNGLSKEEQARLNLDTLTTGKDRVSLESVQDHINRLRVIVNETTVDIVNSLGEELVQGDITRGANVFTLSINPEAEVSAQLLAERAIVQAALEGTSGVVIRGGITAQQTNAVLRSLGIGTVRASEFEGGVQLTLTSKATEKLVLDLPNIFVSTGRAEAGVLQPIKTAENMKYLIRSLTAPELSTGLHEGTHFGILASSGEMRKNVETQLAKHFGKDAKGKSNFTSIENMTVEQHENIASLAEQYFLEGGAQGRGFRNRQITLMFDTIKQEMLRLKGPVEQAGVQLSEPMQYLLDGMWGGQDIVTWGAAVDEKLKLDSFPVLFQTSAQEAQQKFIRDEEEAKKWNSKFFNFFLGRKRHKGVSLATGGTQEQVRTGVGQMEIAAESADELFIAATGLNPEQIRTRQNDLEKLITKEVVSQDEMLQLITSLDEQGIIGRVQEYLRKQGPVLDAYEAAAAMRTYGRMLMSTAKSVDPDAQYYDNASQSWKRLGDASADMQAQAIDNLRLQLLEAYQDAANHAGRQLHVFQLAQLPFTLDTILKKQNRLMSSEEMVQFAQLFSGGLTAQKMDELVDVVKNPKKRAEMKSLAMMFYYNSMLSSPTTHGTNTLMNFLWSNYMAGHRAAQSVMDKALNIRTPEKRRVFIGESKEMLKSMYLPGTGTHKKARDIAWAALQSDFVFRTLKTQGADISHLSEAAQTKVQEAAPLPEGTVEYLTKWEQEMGHIDTGMASLEKTKGQRYLFSALGAPTRFLRAMDLYAKTVAHDAELNATALRLSKINQGGGPQAVQAYLDDQAALMNTKGAELPMLSETERQRFMANPQFKKIAGEFNFKEGDYRVLESNLQRAAEHSTFQDRPGAFTQDIMTFRSRWWPARLMVPFVQTIANLSKRGAEFTPGIGELAGRSFGLTQRERILKQVEGGVMLSAATLAMMVGDWEDKEMVTGPPPRNKSEREAKERTGWQPYSIKVGDTYVSYARAEPFGFPLGIMTTIYDSYKRSAEANADPARKDQAWNEMAFKMTAAAKEFILDSTFMRGVGEFLADDDVSAKMVAGGVAGNMIPFGSLWRTLNNSYEASIRGDVTKRNWTMHEMFGQKLPPGFSQALRGKIVELDDGPLKNARIGLFGKEVTRSNTVDPENMLKNFMKEWMPLQTRVASTDPVEQEFKALGWYPGMPSKIITIRKQGYLLSDDAYRDYVIAVGTKLKPELDKMVNRQSYQRIPDRLRKVALLRKTIGRVRDRELKSLRRKLSRDIRATGGSVILQ